MSDRVSQTINEVCGNWVWAECITIYFVTVGEEVFRAIYDVVRNAPVYRYQVSIDHGTWGVEKLCDS